MIDYNQKFVAIDFETATGYLQSPCAVGIVTVERGIIQDEYYTLIQPPENKYWWQNIKVHGITPEMTQKAPEFPSVFPEIERRLRNQRIVAHNEPFDRSVLQKTMQQYRFNYADLQLEDRWLCTLRIYRSLGFKPANLSACCSRMGIPLQHHEALSDARACAQLYLEYLKQL